MVLSTKYVRQALTKGVRIGFGGSSRSLTQDEAIQVQEFNNRTLALRVSQRVLHPLATSRPDLRMSHHL